jgi:hypothetical protein
MLTDACQYLEGGLSGASSLEEAEAVFKTRCGDLFIHGSLGLSVLPLNEIIVTSLDSGKIPELAASTLAASASYDEAQTKLAAYGQVGQQELLDNPDSPYLKTSWFDRVKLLFGVNPDFDFTTLPSGTKILKPENGFDEGVQNQKSGSNVPRLSTLDSEQNSNNSQCQLTIGISEQETKITIDNSNINCEIDCDVDCDFD